MATGNIKSIFTLQKGQQIHDVIYTATNIITLEPMRNLTTFTRNILLCSIGTFFSSQLTAQVSQTVSEIITTYGSYWKSGFDAINPVKPDSSHDLLAFTYKGTRYSTGVNDNLLTARGDGNFSPQVFHALPVVKISGTVNSNTKVALGQLYDGVDNGASNPRPQNNLAYYLTDGAAGLDLGTGIANLPQGDLVFNITIINPAAIGDGIPDILITQIADPSNGTDSYEFSNSSDATVGQPISISFSGINAVGNWTGDFYEASTNPMQLTSSFTKSDRPIRLWAADFSYFGITAANYKSISKFKIHLNGNSDVAFIAYNVLSSYITLPVKISYFRSTQFDKIVALSWQTESGNNVNHFEVETGTDGEKFRFLATMPASGNSSVEHPYSYQESNVTAGQHYYRLKIITDDGKYSYSSIVKETISDNSISVFPNPGRSSIAVNHPKAKPGDKLEVFSESGRKLLSQNIITGATETFVNISAFSSGNYILMFGNGSAAKQTIKFAVK